MSKPEYVTVLKECPFCHANTSVTLPKDSYTRWKSGSSIQDAWPGGSATERETLISGLCDVCQGDVFDE